MKRFLLLLLAAAVLLSSCGYRLGGLRRAAMRGFKTYSVEMFENRTLFPSVAMQVTTAITDSLQRDGTFRLASPEKADFRVIGAVSSVQAAGLRTNAGDTYLSSEVGLRVYVSYSVINNRTGKLIFSRLVNAQGSFFNDDTGNVQTARDSALSYAARQAAELVVQSLTLP